MQDVVEHLMQTNLDIHFGRLAPLDAKTMDDMVRGNAVAGFVRQVSEYILRPENTEQCDTRVQRVIFSRQNAVPPWLLNRGIASSGNDFSKLEPCIRQILTDAFYRRRFVDYMVTEADYYVFQEKDQRDRNHWRVRRISELCDNAYNMLLNKEKHVIKLEAGFLQSACQQTAEARQWLVKSIGTITHFDFATKGVFDFTTKFLETRYKTAFIPDVFKKIFADIYRAKSMDRWGVLVVGDVPKIFTLTDFQTTLRPDTCAASAHDMDVRELMRLLLELFDTSGTRLYPEARFRLGPQPPQSIINRLGSMFWLRKALQHAKSLQEKSVSPQKTFMVAVRSFLQAAANQKSILYACLRREADEYTINPCYIHSIDSAFMVLHSPHTNKLNTAPVGQEFDGYFSVSSGCANTYCNFRTQVLGVTHGRAKSSLIKVRMPESFELNRRRHKRIMPEPQQVILFRIFPAPANADWPVFDSIGQRPGSLCQIPDASGNFQIKDISAGGVMLEIHRGSPAFSYFTERNRLMPLLGILHLSGKQNISDLRLGVRLEIKNISHSIQSGKKSVGMQFVKFGEIQENKAMRWSDVEKNGIFLINEWIFRNTVLARPRENSSNLG
jgi:hypothetical protein